MNQNPKKRRVQEFEGAKSSPVDDLPLTTAVTPSPVTPLRSFLVRVSYPQSPPISYSIRAATIEDAKSSVAVIVTEEQPRPVSDPELISRFVKVKADKSAACPAGRSIEVRVKGRTEEDAIEAARAMVYDQFVWEPGSVTLIVCGDAKWEKQKAKADLLRPAALIGG